MNVVFFFIWSCLKTKSLFVNISDVFPFFFTEFKDEKNIKGEKNL